MFLLEKQNQTVTLAFQPFGFIVKPVIKKALKISPISEIHAIIRSSQLSVFTITAISCEV